MLLDRFNIQPAENRKFTIDYSARLQNGNVIVTIGSIVVTPDTSPTPFFVSGALGTDGDKVILFATGGEDLTTYKADITVNTFDGQTWQDEIEWNVEEI